MFIKGFCQISAYYPEIFKILLFFIRKFICMHLIFLKLSYLLIHILFMNPELFSCFFHCIKILFNYLFIFFDRIQQGISSYPMHRLLYLLILYPQPVKHILYILCRPIIIRLFKMHFKQHFIHTPISVIYLIFKFHCGKHHVISFFSKII